MKVSVQLKAIQSSQIQPQAGSKVGSVNHLATIIPYRAMYSQTCVKQAPMGMPKTCCLRQVLAQYRNKSSFLPFKGSEIVAFEDR